MQSEIAQAVAAQLKLKLLGDVVTSETPASSQHLTAYDAVLRLKEAEQIARKVITIEPLQNVAWYALGSVLVALGHYDEAEQDFRKVLELQRVRTAS